MFWELTLEVVYYAALVVLGYVGAKLLQDKRFSAIVKKFKGKKQLIFQLLIKTVGKKQAKNDINELIDRINSLTNYKAEKLKDVINNFYLDRGIVVEEHKINRIVYLIQQLLEIDTIE